MRVAGIIVALVASCAEAQPVDYCNVPPYSSLPECGSAPALPTPPSALFYFAPTGGFGVGSGPCRGQPLVDTGQNVITYARSAGTAGDGGVAVATCIRETDGKGVELAASEPIVMDMPGTSGTTVARGLLNEAGGTNFLTATNDLGAATWTATAAVTRDVWTGPFSQYRTQSGFEQVNDSSGAASQSVCQTLTTGTTGNYAFSCWLRAGTLTTARLSIAGTGNAAGDRTCTITGLDTTLSRDDRKGCVTTTPYAAGLTAVTVCVLPGSVAADTGTIGAVDCQLEKNDHITSYIPNGWPAGTSTRLVSTATAPTLPATLTLSDTAGCVASDLYTFKYDSETFWSIITMSGPGGSRGPYYFPDTTARGFDGVNIPAQSRASLYNAIASAKVGWAADGGLSIQVYDAGVTTAAYDGTMFGGSIAANTISLENSAGSQDGIIANVVIDNADYKCSQYQMANITRVGWLGDSISARTSPDPINPPIGFSRRKRVNVTNLAVVGAQFNTAANNCVTQWATGGNGTYDTIVLWCGVNDILAGTGGVTLFNTEKAWVEEWAYRGLKVYWANISPFKGYDSTGSKLTERNNFNSSWTTYCAAPATGVKCIDMAAALKDTVDSDSLLAAYSFDGLHLTQDGANAAAAKAASVYP